MNIVIYKSANPKEHQPSASHFYLHWGSPMAKVMHTTWLGFMGDITKQQTSPSEASPFAMHSMFQKHIYIDNWRASHGLTLAEGEIVNPHMGMDQYL